jgi:predicted alpha/beta-hydrolase family hydrolase
MTRARTRLRAEAWRVSAAGGQTSAAFTPSAVSDGTVFVCAHGAGGHMSDARMSSVCDRLATCGLDIVRFNFLYRENKVNRPDPMPVLQECFDAVVAHVRRTLEPEFLIIGGRSMGGRVASMLAAGAYPCDALMLLAYPLHPAGHPQKLRDAHLGRVTVPVLCLNGTRDMLCRRDLMQQTVDTLGPAWTMHWLQDADHSFQVLKSSGRTDQDVLDEVAHAYERWRRNLRLLSSSRMPDRSRGG